MKKCPHCNKQFEKEKVIIYTDETIELTCPYCKKTLVDNPQG